LRRGGAGGSGFSTGAGFGLLGGAAAGGCFCAGGFSAAGFSVGGFGCGRTGACCGERGLSVGGAGAGRAGACGCVCADCDWLTAGGIGRLGAVC